MKNSTQLLPVIPSAALDAAAERDLLFIVDKVVLSPCWIMRLRICVLLGHSLLHSFSLRLYTRE
jgi:hypothetical protein